ncbi:MaoC/PaaZ C-terminal domain-containing protein [Geodermatophilus sp. YIM 151500]|uniref:MaoC/PaaZ C-terminal domain-containing protein n=1 Tax=Geodermatophilus sp. YIM 151500 TaxID=2984531 RepID=UPI0021E46723|nr:MaoC/PaaZ C-terminal domain-containing protein [Geodermatophilus sp. YIM 151500]MCV2489299.1 MaoC/PaaZ C-terminal domain-containing protein [Geodermatophilus sp. YIM 151500]
MTTRLRFEGIRVGDQLPALVRTPTTEQLVRYAGAASDPARIHFDEAEARRRGFDGVIVHGLLKAAFLGELVTDWCGGSAWVKRFATQYRGVDYPGRPLVCRGAVTATRVEHGVPLVDLDLWVHNVEGATTTRGRATLAFHVDDRSLTARTTSEQEDR